MKIIANTKQKLKSDIKEKIGKTKKNRVKAKGKTNAAKDFLFLLPPLCFGVYRSVVIHYNTVIYLLFSVFVL